MGLLDDYVLKVIQDLLDRGETKDAIARAAEIKLPHLNMVMRGERSLSGKAFDKLCNAYGMDPHQVLGGGPTLVDIKAFTEIPKAEARPSAGGGSLETDGTTVEFFAFRTDWLSRKATDPGKLRLMSATGSSMESTIADGDMVLVNEGDNQLVDERVYVVRVGDDIFVKRFFRAPGRYMFRGDNLEASNLDLSIDPADESVDWEIIGRVIWVGKEL